MENFSKLRFGRLPVGLTELQKSPRLILTQTVCFPFYLNVEFSYAHNYEHVYHRHRGSLTVTTNAERLSRYLTYWMTLLESNHLSTCFYHQHFSPRGPPTLDKVFGVGALRAKHFSRRGKISAQFLVCHKDEVFIWLSYSRCR